MSKKQISTKILIAVLVLFLVSTLASAKPYRKGNSVYMDINPSVFVVQSTSYIEKFLDFSVEKISDADYRVNWKWNNPVAKKEIFSCSDATALDAAKCSDTLSKTYLPEKKAGDISTDLQYLKEFGSPKLSLSPNIILGGDFDIRDDSGSFDFTTLSTKETGDAIKVGFGSAIINITDENVTLVVNPEAENCMGRVCTHKISVLNNKDSEFCFDSNDLSAVTPAEVSNGEITFTTSEFINESFLYSTDDCSGEYLEKLHDDFFDVDYCIYNGSTLTEHKTTHSATENLQICLNKSEQKEFVLSFLSPWGSNGKWNLSFDYLGETYTLDPYWNSQNLTFNGTYYPTFLNDSGFIQLNASYDNGWYLSGIFDSGGISHWDNISWIRKQEMPNNQEIEQGVNGINMSQNVLLFHMNELSGNIVDYSGNGNNGTTYGGVTYNVSGVFDRALKFNGTNGYIVCSDSPSLSITSKTVTVEAWVNFVALPSSSVYYMILSKKNNTILTGYAIQIYNSSGTISLYFSINGNHNINAFSFTTGTWYHIVGVYNGTNIKTYINGVQLPIVTAYSSNIVADGSMLYIARYPVAGYLNGAIDEISVYNRSLSPQEIIDRYMRKFVQLNLTARSCDDSLCSGDSWSSALTYPQNLSVADNPYFQYNASFYTSNLSVSPQLWNVSVGYTLLSTTTSTTTTTTSTTSTTTTSTTTTICVMDYAKFQFRTSLGAPLPNVHVEGWNMSGIKTIDNYSDSSGNLELYIYVTDYNFTFTYPTSNYTAVISNISGADQIYLDDWVTGVVTLTNTGGTYLEGQDCSVYITETNSTKLIKDYDTECKQGEPYLDTSGNWASFSGCKFTNSRGEYRFTGLVEAKDGFEYGINYSLHIVCNGKEAIKTFTMGTSKPPDIEAAQEYAKRYSGVIVIVFIIILVILFVIIYVLRKIFKR